VPDQEARLIRCFASVFPGLTEDEVRNCSTESIGMWDSLSSVTLAAVIEEEFGVSIDPDELAQLNSFEAFHARLCAQSYTADTQA
jgi:acyl carrier protein